MSDTSICLHLLHQVIGHSFEPDFLSRSYNRSFNGFAAMLTGHGMTKLLRMEGVGFVFLDDIFVTRSGRDDIFNWTLNVNVFTSLILHPDSVIEFLISNRNAKRYKIIGLSERTYREQKFGLQQNNFNYKNGEAESTTVTVYEYFPAQCDTRNLIPLLIQDGKLKGILLDEPFDVIDEHTQFRRARVAVGVDTMFEVIQTNFHGDPQFLLCLLPESKNPDLYGLAEYGIVTQPMVPTKVHGRYITNCLMKFSVLASIQNHSHQAMQYTPLKTSTPIEQHSRKMLTPFVVNALQHELVLSLQYGVFEMFNGPYMLHYFKKMNGECLVIWMPDDEQIHCSCKEFESSGILCRHVLRVLMDKEIQSIAETLFMASSSKYSETRDFRDWYQYEYVRLIDATWEPVSYRRQVSPILVLEDKDTLNGGTNDTRSKDYI